MAIDFKTPVGRIVWGNPGKATVKKDQQTKQPILRDGKPVDQWAFGLAIPKADFQQYVWPYLAQEAAAGYPQGTPQKFSWKYKDGDSIDDQGKPYNQREGYAGCYVLTITTEAFAPPIFKLQQNGTYAQLTGDQIKCGDFVAVALNVKVNVPTERTHTPGLYINPVAIDHVGYGQPIINGPDAQTLFGGAQYTLPPGASAMPVAAAGAPGMPGTMQPAPAAMPQQPGFPMPQGMPMQQPQPGFQPMPGGGAAPAMQPYGVPAGMPGNGTPAPSNTGPNAMPAAYPSNGQMPAPAPDFTRNAGYPQPQPAAAPYPGQPAPMPGGMPQMMPGAMPQPGQMPGMIPGR